MIAKAQLTFYPTIYAGYTYQNQSFGEVGLGVIFLHNDQVLYRLRAGAMMGATHSEFAIMPKAEADILFNFGKEGNIFYPWYFLVGVESTNKYIAPKAGISFFGILDFTGGYGFSYADKQLNGKQLKGFNFNFSLNIPLVVFAK